MTDCNQCANFRAKWVCEDCGWRVDGDCFCEALSGSGKATRNTVGCDFRNTDLSAGDKRTLRDQRILRAVGKVSGVLQKRADGYCVPSCADASALFRAIADAYEGTDG